MKMIKINLLPKQIKEKQQAEKLVFITLIGVIAVTVFLGGLYTFNVWRIELMQSQVERLAGLTTKMGQVAQGLRIYEERRQEVEKRKLIAEKAVAGRILWSKVLEELMMITPSDVQLVLLSGNSEGVSFSGAVLDPIDDPDAGHKPVAGWLTRLSSFKPQPEVWLSSSDKQGETIVFTSTIKFKKSPMLPAPPNSSGK